MSKQDEYFLGYRQSEQQRLQQQAELLAQDSAWLFDQVGLSPGAHVVEFGCGPQGCLGLLATRVGSWGRVIGIERSTEAVALARKFITDSQLSNVEVLQGDARDWLDAGRLRSGHGPFGVGECATPRRNCGGSGGAGATGRLGCLSRSGLGRLSM